MMCDALGLPIKFILTGGEVSDFKQAIPLLKAKQADYVIADKGYDSDEIISYIKQMNARPVIPSRSNRIKPRSHKRLAKQGA